MMASPVLSTAQFGSVPQRKKDPSGDPKFNRVRFSGGAGKSKTMHNSKGRVPKPPESHPHHRKAGKRSRRAH